MTALSPRFFMRFGKAAILFFAVMPVLMPGLAGALDIKAGEKLPLEKCIAIALSKHPTIASAAGSLKAQQAVVRQAQAGYWPQVSLSSSIGKRGSSISSVSRPTGTWDDYTNSLSVNQNVYDFDRTNTKVEIQNLALSVRQHEMTGIENQLVHNVKLAYWGELLALRKRTIQADTVRLFQKHVDQSQAFFLYGLRPKYDVTRAEVDLSNAKLEMLKAENALSLARILLKNSMGITDAAPFQLVDDLSAGKGNPDMEQALDLAFQNRPDLKALLIQKAGAVKTLELTKRGHYPQLFANANYSLAGDKYPLDSSWYVGGTLSIPIFSGFLVKNQIEEAAANASVVDAKIEILKQNIRLEVVQAYLNLQDASARIVAAAFSIRKAEENVDLAAGRYTHGVGNPIEVADALLSLNQARLAHLTALFDRKVSSSNLEKAMGEK